MAGPFLTARRLRDYPRLMLAGAWGVEAFNILARQGWQGGLHQIIGTDFVTLYAAGQVYRSDALRLYDWGAQSIAQQALIQPTSLPGLNPFISPPYVAWAYSALAALPVTLAFIVWTVVSLACAVAAALLAHRHLASGAAPEARRPALPAGQLVLILLSSYAFVEGWQVGQNHTLTLLLVTGICCAALRERWGLAGLLTGGLLYKPQFALGFLILWVIWRRGRALIGFALAAALWLAPSLIAWGPGPYREYLAIMGQLLQLPRTAGFPGYLLVTPYGLLATLLPPALLPGASLAGQALGLALATWLAWQGWRSWKSPAGRPAALALAILFPLLATPYTLLHDLIILLPAFLLWSQSLPGRVAGRAAITSYLAVFLLPVPGFVTRVALLAGVPLGLAAMLTLHSLRSPGSLRTRLRPLLTARWRSARPARRQLDV